MNWPFGLKSVGRWPPACVRYSTRGPLRILTRVFRLGLLVYVGLLVVLSSIQSALIFPGKATQGRADAYVRPGPDEALVKLPTSAGPNVAALYGKALDPDGRPEEDGEPRPAIVYFYGNGMCMAHCLREFEAFRRLGVHVLIPDYLGYGLSEGEAGEASFYETADACWDFLQSRREVDPARIVVAGWSIGGAVAIDLAARKPAAGLMAFCTFTNLREMTRRTLPFLPAGLLLKHRFESLEKIGKVRCPILLGHGENDQLVPCGMSERLGQRAGGPVWRFTTEADHNDFWAIGPGRIFEQVGAFLSEAVGADRAVSSGRLEVGA